MTVRRLNHEEKTQACELAWRVFSRFEAPEYPPEGVEEFRRFLDDRAFISRMPMYGAFYGGRLVGMLAMREPRHISLFFVEADCQGRGVGRRLFERMKRDYAKQVFTVHSAPRAVGFYRRLGFAPLGEERVSNGIRYVPMRYGEE